MRGRREGGGGVGGGAEDVDVVADLVVVRRDGGGADGDDGRLLLEAAVGEVAEAPPRLHEGDRQEDPCGSKDAGDLRVHGVGEGVAVRSAAEGVEGPLVHHGVERSVREPEPRRVHHHPPHPGHGGVLLGHLLDGRGGDVDVGDVMVPRAVHVGAEGGVAAAEHQHRRPPGDVVVEDRLEVGVPEEPLRRHLLRRILPVPVLGVAVLAHLVHGDPRHHMGARAIGSKCEKELVKKEEVKNNNNNNNN